MPYKFIEFLMKHPVYGIFEFFAKFSSIPTHSVQKTLLINSNLFRLTIVLFCLHVNILHLSSVNIDRNNNPAAFDVKISNASLDPDLYPYFLEGHWTIQASFCPISCGICRRNDSDFRSPRDMQMAQCPQEIHGWFRSRFSVQKGWWGDIKPKFGVVKA